VQLNRILKNLWFFLELTLKSLCIYAIQFSKESSTTATAMVTANQGVYFDPSFYLSLKGLFELILELLVKSIISTNNNESNHQVASGDLIGSFRSCNRSLAMFVKKALNVLERRYLFALIAGYLDAFHLCDKVNI
jgi:hypothetical protein